MTNLISPTKASEQWGVHRTVLYKKMRAGELSYTKDVSSSGKSRRLIDPAEMLRVFGEPETDTCKTEINNEIETKHSESGLHLDYIEHLKEQLTKKDSLLEKQAELIASRDQQVQALIEQVTDMNQRLLPAPMEDEEYPEDDIPQPPKRKWWRFGRKTEGVE